MLCTNMGMYVCMCMMFGGFRATGNITELCAEHFLEQQHP